MRDRTKTATAALAAIATGLGVAALVVALVALRDGDPGEAPPSTDDPAAFTQAYVAEAIAMYEAEGREAAFAHYNSPESAVERWYLFVVDPELDELVQHPNPGLLGAKTLTRLDARGYAYGAEVLKATEEGRWVSYYYRTYQGARAVEEGEKHAWVVRHDGLLFGSGWYENVAPLPSREDDPAAFTQWFVQDAVDVLDTGDAGALAAAYNDPASMDGDWYVYVLDADGTVLANPAMPEYVGENVTGRAGVGAGGTYFGPRLLEATAEGVWVSYHWRAPGGGTCWLKRDWAVRRGETIIVSGWLEPTGHPLLPSKCDPADYTIATVMRAIARYEAEGLEATIAYYSSAESIDGPWYVGIIDGDGVSLAHYDPAVRGQSLDGPLGVDVTGYEFGADMLAIDETGGWVTYVFLNPETGVQQRKHAWGIRHDGLLFGSGWYEAVE